jgi:hypothetical protein
LLDDVVDGDDRSTHAVGCRVLSRRAGDRESPSKHSNEFMDFGELLQRREAESRAKDAGSGLDKTKN